MLNDVNWKIHPLMWYAILNSESGICDFLCFSFVNFLFQMAPVAQLKGHTGGVTCVRWPTQYQIISTGWDHTTRIWDANTAEISDSFVCFLFLNHQLPHFAHDCSSECGHGSFERFIFSH
jgi:WD40 repeat protein